MQRAAARFDHIAPAAERRGGVSLRGVTRRFGSALALDACDLEVEPGEFLALVGPSGAGKSTVLRMIAGLDEPDAGCVSIGGSDMDGLPPKARDIAMVFQAFALYPHLTVFRNLATPLELQRRPRAEIEARVGAAAKLLDIEFLLNRKPTLLSGGQRQRVALARAMVRNPAVFLFDEPLSHLDAQHRAELRSEILAMHRRSGASMVYVTHDQQEAIGMADRIAVLRDGSVEQVGTPEELFAAPANAFVAGFFGAPAMNLVAARVGNDGLLQLGALTLPLRSPLVGAHDLTFGLRAEHLRETPDAGTLPLDTIVRAVELAGASMRVTVSTGGIELVASLSSRCRVRPGDRLVLHADLAHAHLFDAASGAALPLLREQLH